MGKGKYYLIAILCFYLFVFQSAITAKEIPIGTKLKIVTKWGGIYEGKLWSKDSTLISLRSLTNSSTIAISDIEKAYKLKRATVRGAFVGVIFGGAIASLIIYSRYGSDPGIYLNDKWGIGNRTGTLFIAGGAFAIIGGLFGSVLYYASPIDKNRLQPCVKLGQIGINNNIGAEICLRF